MSVRPIFALLTCLTLMSTVVAQDLSDSAVTANLDAIQQYAIDNAMIMSTATHEYLEIAQTYYDVLADSEFDYQAAWDIQGDELAQLVLDARSSWIDASVSYEVNEGIVAGVPSLAYYDVWIDAGAPASEDPDGALEWQLELPNGEILESPGNFFHNLTEPTLWGTHEAYVGLGVDLNGDGEIELGEILPEANMLLGTAQGLDSATMEMLEAIEAWEPTLEDAFTAMVVMVPTMNEYFGQWKESAYIAGTATESESFVALSRLVDINGILKGLDVTYDQVGPVVATNDAGLHAQIDVGFNVLLGFVGDLYSQEQDGVVFSGEEADFFGAEAQRQAENLSALLAQAADELELTLELE